MPECPKCGTSLTIVSAAEPADSSDFERFWECWPNRVGKKAAQKAYEKAVKGSPGRSKAIMAAIARQKAWKGRLAALEVFVPDWPNPATWLTGERWLDEPPASLTAMPGPEPSEDTFCERLKRLTDEQLKEGHAKAAATAKRMPGYSGLQADYRAEMDRRGLA